MASDAQLKNLAEYKHWLDRERAAGKEAKSLFLDNDFVAVYEDNDDGTTKYPVLYETDPYTLLREALDLLGIPHEEA